MGEADSQPPIGWRYCGDQLKRWRERSGVSRETLAKEAGYGYEAIKSMEQGRRRPSLRVLQVADQMCGAGGLLEAAHPYLTPEGPRPAAQDFFRYEAEAIAISSSEPMLIPGLLQTEETARALFGRCWPPVDDETIEERVSVRLGRHRVLDTQSTAFSFVIGEMPLCRPLADVATHKGQLRHLLEVAVRRNVNIQVMPIGALQVELNGSVVMMELPGQERIAYQEGGFAGVLVTDPERVGLIAHGLSLIHQVALSPVESTRFIAALLEKL
ncbi:helix-turn-helix domain-containing protein [Streptomyces triculaminicus]|uniref:Helix-turn-helix domain-containing protein n=2 Tax=Streptomyces TaxID=1883 RepID=A0A939FH72_9ACTN|nr:MULTISPECIES: helix-turn-helix transcriptional regulator [Streptomyces]MBO0651961.1 helix-turn-helix domain-containing protein [Streptomyces triculaminicus]QSY47127.1 helix-turn-helix domain-containing protein [Streptomyces griseocarneus]